MMLVLCAGCSTVRITDPPRTATEQFLLNQSTARAVDQLTAEPLRDRKVYVDWQYMTGRTLSDDQSYLVGEVRAKLLMSGVRMVHKREEAQIIVEVRSQAIGTERADNLIGIPSVTVPTLTAQSLATPEVALFKSTRQKGFASVAIVAYWQDTGEVVASSGPFVGSTFRNDSWILGYGPQTEGNIPPAEKQK
jgi:hypothetical protein